MDLSKYPIEPDFSVDPSAEDIEFLQSIKTVSPDCFDRPSGCTTLDFSLVKALDPLPDFWVYVDNGSSDGFFTSYVANMTALLGSPPIFIDSNHVGGTNCRVGDQWDYKEENCIGRSMIDVIARNLELAKFLGVQIDQDQLDEDRRALCQAAETFTKSAKAAHERGVRVMKAHVFATPDGTFVLPQNPLVGAYDRTLEELGMPFLHNGKCLNGAPCQFPLFGDQYESIQAKDWFPDCPEGTTDFTSCNTKTLYPIDFWLMGGRVLLQVTDTAFLNQNLPDPALLQGQVGMIPSNDGALSYRNAALFLSAMAKDLDGVERVHPPTECKPGVNVTSDEHLNREFGGLQPAEYACFNRDTHDQAYYMCSSSSSSGSGALLVSSWSAPLPLLLLTVVLVGLFM